MFVATIGETTFGRAGETADATRYSDHGRADGQQRQCAAAEGIWLSEARV